ncbi:MAG: hypothetical protein RR424_08190, partial [Oscillospiraceae bacterium]
ITLRTKGEGGQAALGYVEYFNILENLLENDIIDIIDLQVKSAARTNTSGAFITLTCYIATKNLMQNSNAITTVPILMSLKRPVNSLIRT